MKQEYAYYIDANEAESWMREKMPLVCSDDYGNHADSTKTVLRKHTLPHEKLQPYESEVVLLRENGQKVIATIKSNQAKMQSRSSPLMDEESFIAEMVDVPFYRQRCKAGHHPLKDEESFTAEMVDVSYEVEEEEIVD